MSCLKTSLKILFAFMLLPFVSFLLLFVGAKAKNGRLMLEGAIYAAILIISVNLPESIGGILMLGSMVASGARSFQLRELWLPKRTAVPRLQPTPYYGPPVVAHLSQQPVAPPYPAPTAPPYPASTVPLYPAPTASSASVDDDLSSALAWVVSRAKQNKHRLPSDAYVTILECCQTLDSVIDAENRRPSTDAQFQYELEAMVREYLPSVLKNYLAIPAGRVNDRQPNGKTPVEELSEQLHLLNGQAEALHASRHGQASSELTSMGNFLREKFGHQQQAKFDFGIE